MNRQKKIEDTALLGIVANVLMALLKIMIGFLSGSLAIMSEGINNATDGAASLLTLVGAKLSARHPDEKHPFGYGRIEYLTSLVIAILILYAGISLLKESVDSILHPGLMELSALALALVAISAVLKFILGIYTIKVGEETGAASLIAVGKESRNDSFFSILTILVALIYWKLQISLDAYAGILFALVILRAGWEIFAETIQELLGRPGEKELANQLYQEIRKTKGIQFAADMMLHNYGPGAWSGSVNVEIDHAYTVGEVYAFLHELQLRILREYQVTMVFGIYAVDNDSLDSKQLRKTIAQFVRKREHVKSYHAVYKDEKQKRIYCDFIVDYQLKDWEELREAFLKEMQLAYPEYEIELTIETEFV